MDSIWSGLGQAIMKVKDAIAISGAMKTVEGTTYYMVPKKLPIINKDGSEGTISLLPDGVNEIAFKFSKKYDPLILHKKTILR